MFAASKTGAPVSAANYIEDVFSTYLYTGNGSTQTITNGIDLLGKGGLVWIKQRSAGVESHRVFDTVRGATKSLRTNATSAEVTTSDTLTAFNSNGFNLGAGSGSIGTNTSASTYVSWTFREQAKFFDIVTYTGNGANRTISHNLGSVPGTIIIKRTDTTSAWAVYHRSLANTQYMLLNTTDAVATGATYWNSTTPTSTVFSLGTATDVNANAGTYVAYLFAHDAGGFGLTGTDNVISCGSFTTSGSGAATVTLGYEPQFVLFKVSGAVDNWIVLDNMRNWSNNGSTGSAAYLYPNLAQAESTTAFGFPTATGFQVSNQANSVGYIYIAIRRGPMKVPTSGTSVFSPLTRTGTGAVASVTGVGFTPDLLWSKSRNTGNAVGLHDRLRGSTRELLSNSTAVEFNDTSSVTSINMDGYTFGADGGASGTVNLNTANYIYWNFKRAPSFFDEVCYTGTGSQFSQTHNLGVTPQFIVTKRRDAVGSWLVYTETTGLNKYLILNATDAVAAGANYTAVSATAYTVPFGSVGTYVSYLFATLAGVSKVGSYTGTGALQTVDCGFAAGARFVLIKRTDSTGDWYVWDSARGITSGNDPYLLLNSTAAEVTTTNYVDTDTTGFKVTAAAPAAINASGGTFIFLAIA